MNAVTSRRRRVTPRYGRSSSSRNGQLQLPTIGDHLVEWQCPLCGHVCSYEVDGTPGSRYHGHTQQAAARALLAEIDQHLQVHTEVAT